MGDTLPYIWLLWQRTANSRRSMAWRGVDKLNEPLLYPERPSTGSSQSTVHVILSCFNDILTEKTTESNLAISKEGSSAGFRKYYVDKLKKVCLINYSRSSDSP